MDLSFSETCYDGRRLSRNRTSLKLRGQTKGNKIRHVSLEAFIHH